VKKFFVILILGFPTTILGQDCCWYGGKVTTELDSITIFKQKIKTIKIYEQYAETDSLRTKKLIKTIDVSNCISEWCDSLLSIEYEKNKIIELYRFYYSDGWDINKSKPGKYRLTHYLDKDGRVIKTQRKWLKGGFLENFDSITYEYNENLLIKANYFSGMEEIFGLEKGEPYKMLFYEYE
jgi:hypothetical protein